MIINDSKRLVFVHIPKCAGTTVRNAIQNYDETGGRFTLRVDYHDILGRIDYVHIPLFILRQYFSDEYRKVVDYNSYAIVRDPYSRFASSFSQYLRRSGSGEIQSQTMSDIKTGVDKAIGVLQRHVAPQAYLPYEYIHFQRQIDFLYDQDVRIIKNIYDTSEVVEILADLNGRLGEAFDKSRVGLLPNVPKANEGLVYRSAWIGKLMELSLPLVKIVKKSRFKRVIKASAHRLLYVPRDEKLKNVFGSQYAREFVDMYYAADIALYNAVSSSKSRKRRPNSGV